RHRGAGGEDLLRRAVRAGLEAAGADPDRDAGAAGLRDDGAAGSRLKLRQVRRPGHRKIRDLTSWVMYLLCSHLAMAFKATAVAHRESSAVTYRRMSASGASGHRIRPRTGLNGIQRD